MIHCTSCGREVPQDRDCPTCYPLMKKIRTMALWVAVGAAALIVGMVEARGEDVKASVPAFSKAAKAVPHTPLTTEERISLMGSARDALEASNILQQAIITYTDAEKKQQAAVAKYQTALLEASKKAGCKLDKEFLCLPEENKLAEAPKP